MLYPNYANQTSLSTNHLEPGEHIGGKANTLKHRPIDFVVPLMRERAMLRELWAAGPAGLRKLPALSEQPVLDLFSEPSSLLGLVAKGSATISAQPELAAAVEGLPGASAAAPALGQQASTGGLGLGGWW